MANPRRAGKRGPREGELPRNGGVPGFAPAPGPTRTRKTEVRAAKPKRPPGTASLHRAQYQLGEGGSVRGSCPMIKATRERRRSHRNRPFAAPRRSREGGGVGSEPRLAGPAATAPAEAQAAPRALLPQPRGWEEPAPGALPRSPARSRKVWCCHSPAWGVRPSHLLQLGT